MFRCERPPRLRRYGGLRQLFVNAAATPPISGGELPHDDASLRLRPCVIDLRSIFLTQDTRRGAMRNVCISFYFKSRGIPPRSSARSILTRTPKPFFSGSRSFSG